MLLTALQEICQLRVHRGTAPVRAPHPHIPKMRSVGEQQQQQQRVTPQCWQQHGVADPTAATQPPSPALLFCTTALRCVWGRSGLISTQQHWEGVPSQRQCVQRCPQLTESLSLKKTPGILNPTPTMPTAHP